MDKNLTSRQIQSQNTYDKIYEVAIKLIEKKGFDNVTVAEICETAGVSIGSFYNHFKSKHDILDEVFKLADDYFLDVVAISLKQANSYENIISFFHYYAKYNFDRGLDFIQQLYTAKNNLFAIKGRAMQSVLQDIIETGQNSGEISLSMTSEEIVNYLFISVRGMVYDWCLHDGEYDLVYAIDNHIKLLIQAL